LPVAPAYRIRRLHQVSPPGRGRPRSTGVRAGACALWRSPAARQESPVHGHLWNGRQSPGGDRRRSRWSRPDQAGSRQDSTGRAAGGAPAAPGPRAGLTRARQAEAARPGDRNGAGGPRKRSRPDLWRRDRGPPWTSSFPARPRAGATDRRGSPVGVLARGLRGSCRASDRWKPTRPILPLRPSQTLRATTGQILNLPAAPSHRTDARLTIVPRKAYVDAPMHGRAYAGSASKTTLAVRLYLRNLALVGASCPDDSQLMDGRPRHRFRGRAHPASSVLSLSTAMAPCSRRLPPS